MATWRKGTLAAFAVSSSAPVGGVLPQESRTEVFQTACSGPGPTGTVGGFPGQAKTGGTLALARASPRSSRYARDGEVLDDDRRGGVLEAGEAEVAVPRGKPLPGVAGLVDGPDVEVGQRSDRGRREAPDAGVGAGAGDDLAVAVAGEDGLDATRARAVVRADAEGDGGLVRVRRRRDDDGQRRRAHVEGRPRTPEEVRVGVRAQGGDEAAHIGDGQAARVLGRGDEVGDGRGQGQPDGARIQRNRRGRLESGVGRERERALGPDAVEDTVRLEVVGQGAHERQRVHLAARREPGFERGIEGELREPGEDEVRPVGRGELHAGAAGRGHGHEGLPVERRGDSGAVAEVGVQVREGVDERRSARPRAWTDVEAREVDRQVGDGGDVRGRGLPGADVERGAEELAVQREAPRLAVVAGWERLLDVGSAGGDEEDVAVVRGQGEAEEAGLVGGGAWRGCRRVSGRRGAWRR